MIGHAGFEFDAPLWGVNGLNVASLGLRSDADEIKF